MQPLELENMQRLVVQGYAQFPYAAYVALRVASAQRESAGGDARARAWLAARLERVGGAAASERQADRLLVEQRRAGLDENARHKPPSDSGNQAPCRLALAFSYEGLGAFGLPTHESAVAAGFLGEFRSGIAGEGHRSRILGDSGASAPEHWRWGNDAQPVHVLLMLFATSESEREVWLERELASLEGLELVDEPVRCALAADASEPFGFRDGISQPIVAGSGTSKEKAGAALDEGMVRAGEFVLGYPNAFGRLPASPTVPERSDPTGMLPDAPLDRSGVRDFGRNGSYLVVRQLAQDVEAFHRHSQQTAERQPQLGDAREIEARLVGRRHDGTPLAPRARTGRPVSPTENRFGYWQTDREGYRCPVGAHVRRSNPRDGLANPLLGVTPARARELADHHRILRRGRTYQRSDGERGLMFLCLQANIERQFEFVQQSWIRGERFGGLQGEQDAIVGDARPSEGADSGKAASGEAEKGAAFTIQQPFAPRHVSGLARYVTVKAGGYFFLPSLPALRYLAALA